MNDDFPYLEGDIFEGGPVELGKYISQILAVGGQFNYEGSTVTITYLPQRHNGSEALPPEVAKIVEATIAAIEEAPVEEAPVEEALVEEAPVVEASVVEAPVVEAPVEEAPVEEAPKPKPRGRRSKAVATATE